MVRLDEQIEKTDNRRIVIGIIFIALAALLFVDNFDILPYHWEHHIFSLPMILIVVGLIILARNGSKSSGIILLTTGAILLAVKILGYHYGIHHLFWPTVLAVIGVLMVVRHKDKHLFSGRNR